MLKVLRKVLKVLTLKWELVKGVKSVNQRSGRALGN